MKETRHFTIEKELYPIFRKVCKEKAISMSQWLENVMKRQLDKWGIEYPK